MRKPMMAGNWKMNNTSGDVQAFFSELTANLDVGAVFEKVDVLFAVPYTLLATASEQTAQNGIRIAAQNMHFESKGAYTGEISAAMLKDVGINATLIGHSERRQYYNETDDSVNAKVKVALAEGILPVACVGETLEEREAGKTNEVVARQVRAVCNGVADPGNLIIAYEPVWAIGTGKSATSDQAQEVHKMIRELVSDIYTPEVASGMRLLYGGSAKPANIDELMSQPDIDGGLVGGASLVPSDFARMITAADR